LATSFNAQSPIIEREANQLDPASEFSTEAESENMRPQKIGKSKAKRAKKAARQTAMEEGGQQFKCAACSQQFASKTKLFSHIKEYDHASPVLKPGKRKIK